jgi:hypothetical protein
MLTKMSLSFLVLLYPSLIAAAGDTVIPERPVSHGDPIIADPVETMEDIENIIIDDNLIQPIGSEMERDEWWLGPEKQRNGLKLMPITSKTTIRDLLIEYQHGYDGQRSIKSYEAFRMKRGKLPPKKRIAEFDERFKLRIKLGKIAEEMAKRELNLDLVLIIKNW